MIDIKEKIKRIADTYGYDAQSRQFIEEMAELTQAINKFWRKDLKCGQLTTLEVPIGSPQELSLYGSGVGYLQEAEQEVETPTLFYFI